MKSKSRYLLLLFVILAVGISACNSNSGAVAEIAPTATLLPIVSSTPRLTATPVPTRTPLPTFTFTPTITVPPPTETNTLAPTATPTITGIIQSLQRVNIRNGPGVDFEAFEALAPGTGVQVIGQNAQGDWFNIKLEDGSEGWIASRLLFIPDTPTPFPTATPSPNLTALFLGTPLPTAIIGGGTVTPTPPGSVATSTPVGGQALAAASNTPAPNPTATQPLVPIVPIVDLNSINLTATALVQDFASPTATVPLTPSPIGGGFNTPIPRTLDAPTSVAGVVSPTVNPALPIVTVPTLGGDAVEVATRPADQPRSGIDVFAFCNSNAYGIPAPANLGAGSSIEIFWAWFASTDEQLRQHTNNAIHELRVNGTQIANVDQFRQPFITQGGDRAVYWYVPFGPLAAGEYLITYRVTWRTAISDGYDFFGPGTSKEFDEESCNFVVR